MLHLLHVHFGWKTGGISTTRASLWLGRVVIYWPRTRAVRRVLSTIASSHRRWLGILAVSHLNGLPRYAIEVLASLMMALL